MSFASDTRMIKAFSLSGMFMPEWVPERLWVEFSECALNFGYARAITYTKKLMQEIKQGEGYRAVNSK